MNTTRLSVGQRFEYTGDMANSPDAGEIIEVIEPTQYSGLRYKCKMDSGKEKIVEALSFQKSIGQRFKTVEQMQEERHELDQYYSKFTIK